jgi:hypothetical protein
MAFRLLHCTSQLRPSLASKYLRGTKVESRGQSASRFAAFQFTSCSCEHFLSRTHTPQPLLLLQLHIISVGISPSFRPISSVHILTTFYLGSALSFFHFVRAASCFSCSAFFASTSISFTPSSLSATPKSQCCDITPHIRRTPCLPHSYDRGSRASLLFVLLHHTRQPRSSGAFCVKMEALHPPSQMTI